MATTKIFSERKGQMFSLEQVMLRGWGQRVVFLTHHASLNMQTVQEILFCLSRFSLGSPLLGSLLSLLDFILQVEGES